MAEPYDWVCEICLENPISLARGELRGGYEAFIPQYPLRCYLCNISTCGLGSCISTCLGCGKMVCKGCSFKVDSKLLETQGMCYMCAKNRIAEGKDEIEKKKKQNN
ncbi:MAG TPA: hypothetical protein VJ327_03105 [Patescibacteria group bacterium]|nr:hypothetical protein [Patescibacteria group bacterium]